MSIDASALASDIEVAVDPSAAPIRERGLRSRAGNAMGRTRTAVLEGARIAVAAAGARKTTMAHIAEASGIAKGTLYNHFRTKEAVFTATVQGTIEQLGDEAIAMAAIDGLAAAIGSIAERIATDPAIAALRDEPAALLPLISLGTDGLWLAARETVAALLTAAGVRSDAAAVELLLRWLLSFAASGLDGDRVLGADLVVAGLAIGAPGIANAEEHDHHDESDRYV